MKIFISLILTFTILVCVINVNAEVSTQTYTDAQFRAMKDYTPAQLKSSISTPEQAIDYLNKCFPSIWMSHHIWEGDGSGSARLRSAEEILNGRPAVNVGRSDIITLMTYLLSDNYDIGGLYAFSHDPSGELDPIKAAIYIYEKGKYKIFDPVIGMAGDEASRYGVLLPEKTVNSLSDYTSIILEDKSLYDAIDSIYAIKDGQGIVFTDKYAWVTVTSPSLNPIYADAKKQLSQAEYLEKKYGHIIPENINKYKLSKMIGGTTLTVEQAKKLVGADPEIIKDKVKTAGDLLLYMLASRMLLLNGDNQIMADGHNWHYNMPAYDTLALNKGNCGRMANLANFLLEGDYQEVGFILHSYTGNGGGHVYNYIKYQSKYYIIDFSDYLFDSYSVANEFNFISLDSLNDYATRWKECYGGLAAIIAHTSSGTHLPNVWKGDSCYYPDDAKFTVIMETPECKVATMPCPSQVPDWKKPQGIIETPSSWAVASVKMANELALIPAFLNCQYTKPITRAEFCALAVRVYENLTRKEITSRKSFLDTNDVDVQKMGSVGVISGSGDGNFKPNDPLSREQAAVILCNLSKALGRTLPVKETNFADKKDISSWALTAVGQIQASGIMSGNGKNFSPKDTYTREQSIATLLRIYNYVK